MKFTVSLKQNRDFKSMYARGKSSAGVYLVIYSRKNRRSHNRLGLTVSTKMGKAVVRNRIRRRIKEAYRLCEHLLLPGFDIVLASRMAAKEAGFEPIKRELISLCRKLGVAAPR